MGHRAGLDGSGKSRPPPTGIRSPDRPPRSESLYRLSYPGPLQLVVFDVNSSLWRDFFWIIFLENVTVFEIIVIPKHILLPHMVQLPLVHNVPEEVERMRCLHVQSRRKRIPRNITIS